MPGAVPINHMDNDGNRGMEAGRSAVIRLMGGGIDPKFTAECSNPYDPGLKKMYVWEDGEREYWTLPGGRVVQVAPKADSPPSVPDGMRLPVSELRKTALDWMERLVPRIREFLGMLHPLEDNRNRLVYFFRFDDFGSKVEESGLPPFIQAGIRADGYLVSLTNTLKVKGLLHYLKRDGQ